MIDPTGDQLLEGGLQALNDALWRQRSRLDAVLFKTKVAKLTMATDDQTFIPIAIGELDQATRELRSEDHTPAKLLRAISHHIAPGTSILTLNGLSELITEPWSRTIQDHALACQTALNELKVLSAEGRALAHSGLQQVQSVLALVLQPIDSQAPEMYDASGTKVQRDRQAVDQLL
ncbi:MAG: hypothetical protein ACC652_03060 [Acidimicrobiales bacterium]